MLGTDNPEVSGVAIKLNKIEELMIQVPLDNLQKTGGIVEHIRLVQAYYTEERLIQITDESDPMKHKFLYD